MHPAPVTIEVTHNVINNDYYGIFTTGAPATVTQEWYNNLFLHSDAEHELITDLLAGGAGPHSASSAADLALTLSGRRSRPSCAIAWRMVSVTNINEVLDGHVCLDLACIDRLCLSAYVPNLQVPGQVV